MKAMCEIPGFLTVAEVAARLGVSHSQVTRYIANCQLPAKKVGQQKLISEKDLRKFVRPPRGNPSFLTR